MRIETNTREYVLSHGREPRGRACWAFQIGYDPEPYWATPNRTFAEAVADARKVAMARDADEVKVLP